MAYFLFVDESGQDHRESPYEVLAGVSVHDAELWPLVQQLQQAEVQYFGRRYSSGPRELKAKKLLNRRVYSKAHQLPPFAEQERTALARSCLEHGEVAGRREITALAQAKIAYCGEVLRICQAVGCRFSPALSSTPM